MQSQLMDHVMSKRLSDLQAKLCSLSVDVNQQGRLHTVPQHNRARLYFFNSLRNKEAGDGSGDPPSLLPSASLHPSLHEMHLQCQADRGSLRTSITMSKGVVP